MEDLVERLEQEYHESTADEAASLFLSLRMAVGRVWDLLGHPCHIYDYVSFSLEEF